MDRFSSLLFVYGTLRDPDLLAGVLARPLNAGAMLMATAPGLRAVHYPGRAYPALVRAPGDAATGLVLHPIPVMIGEELHEADAYLPAIAISTGAEPWTLEAWQAAHKSRVLKGEWASAEQLRQRLIAVRPN